MVAGDGDRRWRSPAGGGGGIAKNRDRLAAGWEKKEAAGLVGLGAVF
jgi:hypothetical protein